MDSLKNYKQINIILYMVVLAACMSALFVCLVLMEFMERVLDLLALDLQTVANCHVGVGNQTLVLFKGSQCS